MSGIDQNAAPRKHPREYSAEELGIDPKRDQKIFTAVFLFMLVLLMIGAMILIATFLIDHSVHEEKVPDNPPIQSLTQSTTSTKSHFVVQLTIDHSAYGERGARDKSRVNNQIFNRIGAGLCQA